jgi:hypothetical protein
VRMLLPIHDASHHSKKGSKEKVVKSTSKPSERGQREWPVNQLPVQRTDLLNRGSQSLN